MSTQLDPTLLQDAWDAQSYAYSCMSAFAWICYDIIIALDQEVEHIWQARLSAAKVFYLLSRYITVIIVFLFWLNGASNKLSDSFCHTWPIISGIGMVIIGVSVDMIQLLRVRAIYKANRRVTIPLYLFFAGVFLAAIIVIATQNSGNNIPSKTIYTIGCYDNANNTSTLAAWCAELALGAVFFFLTVWKLHPYLLRRSVRTPFLTAFVEGGVVYYAVILAVELLNTIFMQIISNTRRTNLLNIMAPWALTVYGIAGPRLVLHLRGVMSRPVPLEVEMEAVLVEEGAVRQELPSDLHSQAQVKTVGTMMTASDILV